MAYFIDVVMKSREAAMQTVCRGRLGQLLMALHNYHDTYGSFPPAYLADADGKPMHSWRVLVLPFLDEADVYRRYRFDEPWNSPHNAALAKLVPGSIFHCPDSPDLDDTTLTDYVVIVGPDTVFPGPLTTSLNDFHDGTDNTILVAEIARSDIHWMEPRDLSTDQMSFQVNDPQRPSISSLHPLGPGVIFADSIGAYRLGPSIRPTTLKALTTINGSEPVSKDALVPKDHSRQLAE